MNKYLLLTSLLALTVLPIFSQNFGNRFIYHEAADSTNIFTHYVTKQHDATKPERIKPSKFIAYNGSQSARFELRDTDEMNNSGTRAEITFPTTTNLNRWYSYAVYFPGDDYLYDTNDEVINQWHQGGGLTPALCIRTKTDSIYLRIVTEPGGDDTWITLDPIQKNRWIEYTLHIIHASNSGGLIEIWKDGRKIMDRPGANMYPVTGGVTNPNWKLGVYKSGWNDASTTLTDRRVIYFDDIKMGNENATYREMRPMRDF